MDILSIFCFLALFSHVLSNEMKDVTFGSVIKLQHERYKLKLHSHEVTYGTGSGQQSVTGFIGDGDANDYWVVTCPKDEVCRQGKKVKHGAKVRLFHTKTRKWLHSHLHGSPLSNNFEISCYGSEGQSDGGDLWIVELEGKGGVWQRDQKVRFQHFETKGYLSSNDKKYGRPIGGQHEICGIPKKSADTLWTATEGVYFPSRNA